MEGPLAGPRAHRCDAGARLTVDGQVYEDLLNGDRIRVERADVRLRMVDTGIRSFYEVLREKLAWGGSPRYGQG